jgi:hypothetical protein
MERWWPAASYLVFFSQVALALPLAALGGLYIGLGAAERRALLVPLQARLRQRFGPAPTS